MTDVSPTLVGDSNRLNAADLMEGPQTFTVANVEVNLRDKKRPWSMHLVELPGKPYQPPLGMRKVIAHAWGRESDAYQGRRFTLFRNPDVMWQGKKEGGVEVAAMSHIAEPFEKAIPVNQKSVKKVRVEVLPADAPTAEPQPDWHALIDQAEGDVDTLRNIYQHAQQLGASEGVLNAIKTAATKEN